MEERDPVTIDEYTVAASPLEMCFGDTHLSTGTCFFWEAAKRTYLVTNWHNVSGKNPLTGKYLSSTAAEPDRVWFDIWENRTLNNRGSAWIPLNDDSTGQPLWLEHPAYRHAVDVVCVPLPENLAVHVFPANHLPQQELKINVADDVFILGYPLGYGVERLPIWKRASIASEPGMNVDKLPKLLVDTASASGMSGSLVIRRSAGSAQTEDGNFSFYGGPVSRLLGVYSGRIVRGDSLDAQLGIVWKIEVVSQIIAGNVSGSR